MSDKNSFGGPTSTDPGLAAFMRNVYLNMTAGLAVTGIVAYFLMSNVALLAAFTGSMWFWAALIFELVLVFGLMFVIGRISPAAALLTFFAYSALNGLTLAPLVFMYTAESVWSVFFITSGMFAALSAWGFFTKKDLSAWGKVLFMAMVGLIIAMIVNIFLASSMMSFIISAIAVIVFAALTAYDTQKIREMYSGVSGDETMKGRGAVVGALVLYLDFINMFIHLLRLFGTRK